MKRIRLMLFVVCVSQLTGCMGTLKVLSAIGQADQANRQNQSVSPTPNYYPTYTSPQVVQPQVGNSNGGGNYICNTIGYVTTCSEH